MGKRKIIKNNGRQNIAQKNTNPSQIRGELTCSGLVISSWSGSGMCRKPRKMQFKSCRRVSHILRPCTSLGVRPHVFVLRFVSNVVCVSWVVGIMLCMLPYYVFCVVLCFCFGLSSSCVISAQFASASRLSILDCPFGFSNAMCSFSNVTDRNN